MIVPKPLTCYFRTGSLHHMSAGRIADALGFESNGDLDLEHGGKGVAHCWEFQADGEPCAIWSYRRSERIGVFSTYGPAAVFVSLFGDAST